jgi:hypothetical protein
MNNDFIFNAVNSYSSGLKTEKTDQFYSIIGSEDYLDENNCPAIKLENDTRVLAKKTLRKDGSIKYSIKLTNGGKMQNPLSIYGTKKDNNFLDRKCRSNNSFKEVSYKVFDLYMNFLKTKNTAWLHNAEREAE